MEEIDNIEEKLRDLIGVYVEHCAKQPKCIWMSQYIFDLFKREIMEKSHCATCAYNDETKFPEGVVGYFLGAEIRINPPMQTNDTEYYLEGLC